MQENTTAQAPAEVAGVRRQLRPKEVSRLLGVSKSTLWNWIRQGTFPKGHKLTKTVTVFYADEVAAWQRSQSPYTED